MSNLPNPFNTLQTFEGGKKFYSLPELTKQFPGVARLPVSIRLVLESVLRNCDGKRVRSQHPRTRGLEAD
jgi:aconitate hydratase